MQFSSKPASGLSQASIFGASLGGLILNIQGKHPNTHIRNEVGVRDEDGRVVMQDASHLLSKAQRHASHQAFLARGGIFYTRPVIDYDMALFLAPMEMAGAVMGVLIQKILPDWLFLSLAGIILGLTSFKTYSKFFATYKVEKQHLELRRIANEREEEGENQESVEIDGYGLSPTDDDPSAILETPSQRNQSIDDGDQIVGSEGSSSRTMNQYGKSQEKEGNSTPDKSSKRVSVKSGNGLDDVTNVEEITINAFQVSPTVVESGDITECTEQEVSEINDEHFEKRRKLLEQDARQYPAEKLLYLAVLWLGLTFITFLKGGKGVDSLLGITCESPWFIVLIVVQFLWTFGFALLFGVKLIKKQEVSATNIMVLN